jgi:archaetidylinositol phosphate synthase
MVLDSKRNRVDFIMDPSARLLRNVHPNTISVLALLIAVIAGVMLFFSDRWYPLLIAASLAVLLSGFFDGLDGKVARLSGKTSKKGDFVDHVLDRYADVFLIGAVAISSWCSPYIGVIAIVGVLLTSYMGTQAQAVGVGRHYGGVLGRADRMVLLIVMPALQYVLLTTGASSFDLIVIQTNFLEIMMIWFAIVGNITAVQRAWTTYRALK